MQRNVGQLDKTVRLVLGVVGIALAVYFKTWWGLVALVPLLTGLINFCPLYRLLGINSCKIK